MKKFSFVFDNSLHSTKVQQLTDAIARAIDAGVFAVGDKLPSVNQMNEQFDLSRDTVFKAYRELKRRGLIESVPTKGYMVIHREYRVFLFLDSYSPFKDVLYNSLAQNLPGNFKVDLAFHHYNFNVFETVILNSIGKYNLYVVMNFNDKKINAVLKKIDPNKLLILDWGDYKSEELSFIGQDFGEQPYHCFQELAAKIKKYKAFQFVYPTGSAHPRLTWKYFHRFCKEEGIEHQEISRLNDMTVQAEKAYLVFRQKDLVTLLKICKSKSYLVGGDIGIVAYNDNPLYEVIENGITVISTDFGEMGRRAARFILQKEKTREIIPTKVYARGSL
jgi:DNA-binding transcriptional regulator YhcF (GntR family)